MLLVLYGPITTKVPVSADVVAVVAGSASECTSLVVQAPAAVLSCTALYESTPHNFLYSSPR